ncbi:MAG: hypothetical protein ACR2MB_07285 [Acidimicrobiales bacterium]
MSSTPTPRSSPTANLLWGCGDVAAAFTGDRRVVPWPSAPRWKHKPLIEQGDVDRLLGGPPALADLEPRAMFATQTFCVASHVRYYAGTEWARTGRTSADQGRPQNRYPLVWIDEDGRQILLGGHHRSLAALIQGRPVRCRVLRPEGDSATAVLPLLLIGSTSALAELATSHASAAATAIEEARTVLVSDLATAADVLCHLGFSDELAEDRLTMARTGHTRLAG